MNYAVNLTFNQTLFVEADDKEEASDVATEQFEEIYGLAPGQAEVNSIEEIK